ncbi:sialidase family protein [uncultured Gilvimarinus sp.]|uniref:sialidase family protein n=1 Tax=uncultured Gilvimarinus sp. TaxID=1689143 RepID=UPI0030ECB0CD
MFKAQAARLTFMSGWWAAALLSVTPLVEAAGAPISVAQDLFDVSQPATLGLAHAAGAETFRVYGAQAETNQYNHGAVSVYFNGHFYTQWQSSACDEDAADTHVLYATSADAEQWSEARTLAPARPDAVVTNGGWWVSGDTLVAYLNIWPTDMEPRGGWVEYITSTDGKTWSKPNAVTAANDKPLAGVIEQDVRLLRDGKRLLTAVHVQPGLIAKPYYTDDLQGVSGWRQGEMQNLPHDSDVSREIEPSWLQRKDGALVMTFRDQASSFKVLAAVSEDRGEHWSTPAISNIPDSRAKQSAGNLPDGAAFVVNNPSGKKHRAPLVISTSADGQYFDKAFVLRSGGSDLPQQKFAGRYKRVGYSYPKSYVHGDYVYVSYATGKEDIEITRIPVSSLVYK